MEKRIISPKRVLIASANPLFGKGLDKTLLEKLDPRPEVRFTSSLEDTFSSLESWQPDLVIVDYDDRTIDRGRFLSHFVSSSGSMQVMLVSLQASGEVIVYDRRSLAPSQVDEWLNVSWLPQPTHRLASPDDRKGNMTKHFVIAGLLVIVLTFLVNTLLGALGLLPQAASAQAGSIDRLFRIEFFLISFLFSLIVVMITYSMVVFRRRKGQSEDGAYFTGSSKLEVVWTIIPLGIVLFLSYIGSQSLAEVRTPVKDALQVNVTAGQWFWAFEYPEYGIKTSELYLPVDRQVQLLMTSQDVIHSFWVPEFRVKQDVLPGENLVKELRFTPTNTGQFPILCAELCGGAHAYMNSTVTVMEPADFEAWLVDQSNTADASPAEIGEQLATSTGCIGCHTLDGTPSVGPTWQGLFESERTLMDGSTIVADEQYLHTAIVDPNVHIPEGYPPNVMPQTYDTQLSEEEITAIVEFMKTLQ